MAGAFLSRVAGLFLGPQVVGKKGSALEGLRSISLEKRGRDSPIRSYQTCTTAGSVAVCAAVKSFQRCRGWSASCQYIDVLHALYGQAA